MWRKLWAAVFGKRKARPVRASGAPELEAVVVPAVEVDTAEVTPAAEAVEAAPAVEAAATPVVAPAVEVDTAVVAPVAEVVEVEAASAVEAAEPAEVAPVAKLKPIEVAQVARAAPAEAVEADGVWPALEELERLAGIVRAPAPAPVTEPAEARAGAAMSEARFWALIEETAELRAEGSEVQAEALREVLAELSPDELVAFGRVLADEMKRANRWDLWGAAYVAHGGASDDGFAYFRLWLIGQGQAAFEAVLADPDALARVVPRDAEAALEFEGLMYVAGDVWCEQTGREAEEWPVAVDTADEPDGEPFEEDEAVLAERYPQLWKRFAEAPLG